MTEAQRAIYDQMHHGESSSHDDIPPLPRVAIHVFCETQETAALVETASIDRRMEKVHFKVQMGGAAAAMQAYRNAATPNLIVLEAMGAKSQLVSHIEKLSQVCDENTRVLIIGHLNDVVLYRDLLKRGVSDYLMAPFDPSDFLKTLSDIFTDPDVGPIGKTFAFIGARGGVGASTIAHNIAWSLSNYFDNETAIADLDVAFGTAGLDLNQDPQQTIADAVFSLDRVDAAFIDRLLTKCSQKLSLLAAPAMLDRTVDCPEETFEIILDSMRVNVPNIVVDIPHVWTAWARKTLISADQVIIVAEPDLACLRNVKNLVDVIRAHRQNDKPPLLILNKVAMPKRPEIAIEHFIKASELTPSMIIPFEPGVFGLASNNGQMVAESHPGHKITSHFNDMAQILTGHKQTPKANKTTLLPFVDRLKLWVKS